MSESPAEASVEAIPELMEVGQRLRRAREGRGIGVAELADRLHLAPELLSALENGDRSHLHEPVFVIAQAKRVAQALGVDISQQVEALRHSRLMQLPTPAALARAEHAAAAPASEAGSRGGAVSAPAAAVSPAEPRAGLGRAPLAAAIALLTLLLGLGLAQALRLWNAPRAASPVARDGGGGAKGAAGGATPATAAAPGVLLLRSDEPSWVEVRDPSDLVLFSGTLEKEARFRLGEGLKVLAGRPDLVTVTVGREAPRRLGTISQVAWQSFAPTPAP